MSESMDSDDLAELQNRRLQHAAAVRAAEEAKEDLVQKVLRSALPQRVPRIAKLVEERCSDGVEDQAAEATSWGERELLHQL
jgi:hypothetical protein